MNKLKQRLGIIGGGQLGKMMILEAKKLGLSVTILDPTPDCPAHSIADSHIVAGFHDAQAIKQICAEADVVTYELEHIDASVLMEIEAGGKIIYPTAKSLRLIQNKYLQKTKLSEAGLKVPKFLPVHNIEEIKIAGRDFSYPLLLKACTGGYDGKGNFVVNSAEDAEAGFETLGGGKIPLMAEEFIPYTKEISVLACRNQGGEVMVYPVAENIHRESILEKTIVPARISAGAEETAMKLAGRVMEVFEGVGMFCVEMFCCADSSVYVNEVAPRPHNSGHYTIEACDTSQFEQHVRAVCSLPLGSTKLLRPAVMQNLLGEPGYAGQAVVAGAEDVLALPGVHLHIYGKANTAAGRKMGHLTVIADTVAEAEALSDKAKTFVKIISEQ